MYVYSISYFLFMLHYIYYHILHKSGNYMIYTIIIITENPVQCSYIFIPSLCIDFVFFVVVELFISFFKFLLLLWKLYTILFILFCSVYAILQLCIILYCLTNNSVVCCVLCLYCSSSSKIVLLSSEMLLSYEFI